MSGTQKHHKKEKVKIYGRYRENQSDRNQQIVSHVATQLQQEYGTKGFDKKSIRRMIQFSQLFPNEEIVSTLLSKMSWSHFQIVMPIKEPLQREFYHTMAQNKEP